jgi:hypothetical protein
LAAQIKLFCSSGFFKGLPATVYPVNNSEAIYVDTYAPMFASNYLCLNFKKECAVLISKNEQLDLNCSQRILLVNGPYRTVADRFPKYNQTVSTVGVADVVTPPNNATDAVTSTVSACPRGFSVPTDFDAPGQINVTGNGLSLFFPQCSNTTRFFMCICVYLFVNNWFIYFFKCLNMNI